MQSELCRLKYIKCGYENNLFVGVIIDPCDKYGVCNVLSGSSNISLKKVLWARKNDNKCDFSCFLINFFISILFLTAQPQIIVTNTETQQNYPMTSKDGAYTMRMHTGYDQ